MRLASYAGIYRVETGAGMLTADAARQYAADLSRHADACDRLNAERGRPGQLTVDVEAGEALAV